MKLNEDQLKVVLRCFMSFMKASGLTGDNTNFLLFKNLSFEVDTIIHKNKLCTDPECNFEEIKKQSKLIVKKEGN